MQAIDKIRDEMAKSKDSKITYLGEGVTALLGIHPAYAEAIAAEGKTLAGCMEAIKKGAKGGVSDPEASTRAICRYYGIETDDPRRLAAEVNLALLGGAPQTPAPQTPAPPPESAKPAPAREGFDMDALLGGL